MHKQGLRQTKDIDLEHCWMSSTEVAHLLKVSYGALSYACRYKKKLKRQGVRTLERVTEGHTHPPFIYYNVADLVAYVEKRNKRKGVVNVDFDSIEFSVFADREKYVEAATIPEYAKESGLSEIVIRKRINDLLKLGQITEEDCVVPGTKRIFISGKMKRLFQTYNEIVVSNRTVKTPNVKRKPGQYRPIDQTKCRTCQYYSPYSLTCDYILITRHSRGCNWGDDCDKYQRGKKKREQVDVHLGRNK